MQQNTKRRPILPDPAVRNLSLFEWFVGCALANSSVTDGMDPEQAASNAVGVAMASLAALKAPRVPGKIDAPTEEQMEQWVQLMSRMNADTVVVGRAETPTKQKIVSVK